jgi:hypothetical protein
LTPEAQPFTKLATTNRRQNLLQAENDNVDNVNHRWFATLH